MDKTPFNVAQIENMNVEEIFSEILARQIRALMFHEQWAIIFDFLNLNGFRTMQEYHYVCENKMMRDIQKWYIGNHDKLIPEKKISPPYEIPDDWYTAKREDATPKNVSQFTERVCTSHMEWETETLEFLNAYAKRLHDLSKFNDLMFVQNMIKDVAYELKKAKTLWLALNSVEWNVVYIQEIQENFDKKYKKKMK